MNMRGWMNVVRVLAVVAVSVSFLTACEDEDSPNTGSLDDWFERNPMVNDPRSGTSVRDIVVSPATATITFPGQQVNFRALGGIGAYTWAVADSAVGSVVRLGQTAEAVYTANVVGPNSIIVYDSRGQAGVATVGGETSSLVAVANPDEITQPGGRSILTATGGTPPYNWSVADIALGTIDGPTTGNSVVYVASTVGFGDNTIRCEDAAGTVVNVLIKQP